MKNIRTDMLKESIAEFTNIAQSIKDNSSELVNSLLREAVADEYAKILAEDFAKEEDEEDEVEVKDTDSDTDTDEFSYDSENEEESDETEVEDTEDESEGEGWEEYEDLKVDGEDDTYDFSNADDETIVKVYKRLSDSDDLIVDYDKENNKIDLNVAGTEYIIDLNMDDASDCEEGECAFEITSEDDDNNEINESKMIEIVLNEDSNLGYTTKYQKQDAMTTPPMTEPGKNVNDWDAGVPKGKERPYGTKKAKTTPFTEEDEMPDMDGMDISEENIPVKPVEKWGVTSNAKGDKYHKIDKTWNQNPSKKNASTWGLQTEDNDDGNEEIDEAAFARGAVTRRTKGNNSMLRDGEENYGPRVKHNAHTAQKGAIGDVNEAMQRKHNKIMQENKKLKEALKQLMPMMQEAQVTNASLAYMNELFSENTVAQDEKKAIREQFNEVKTLEESKNLYKRLNRELKKNSKMNLDEDKQFTVENSNKINENTIYASKDLLTSLDIMHKICK